MINDFVVEQIVEAIQAGREFGDSADDVMDAVERILIDAEALEPEAMFYTDIGNIDGRAYPGNSVIISRIPKVILDTFSHHDIMNIAHKHVALGTLNLVDYVG